MFEEGEEIWFVEDEIRDKFELVGEKKKICNVNSAIGPHWDADYLFKRLVAEL